MVESGISAHLIYNPVSGVLPLEEKRLRIDALTDTLREAPYKWKIDVFATEGPGHARELTQQARDNGIRVALLLGGDGLANEGAQSLVGESVEQQQTLLAQSEPVVGPTETVLAYFSLGTLGLLGQELSMPYDPRLAAEALAEGTMRRVDVGHMQSDVGSRYALLMVGVGYDGEVIGSVHQPGCARRGQGGMGQYFSKALETLPTFRGTAATLITEKGVKEFKHLYQAWIQNTKKIAGVPICPDARLNDGKLEGVFISGSGWVQALPAALYAAALPGIPTPFAYRMSEEEFSLLFKDAPRAIQVDGEPVGETTSLRVATIRGGLPLLVPATSKEHKLFVPRQSGRRMRA